MNFKTTYTLFGILAVLFVILGVAVYMEPTPSDATSYVLPSVHKPDAGLKADDVDRVEIQRNRPEAQTIVFSRDPDGKGWHIGDSSGLRADTFAVTGLVRDVLEARRDTTADAPTSLKEYGLDPPAEVITLKKGDREVRVNVGETSPGTENQVVYLTSSDNPKEGVAVKKAELGSVFKPLNDFRDRTLLGSSEADLRAVKISEAKKPTVALAREEDGPWKYTEPPYGATEMEGDTVVGGAQPDKAPSGVRPLLNDLTQLRVDSPADFVADNVTDQDLGKYNLDPAKDPVLRIEVEKTVGTKEDKKPPQKPALLVGVGKAVDGKYYARLDGERSVVKVPTREVDPLRKLLDDPGALRDRNLVRFEGARTPDAVDVKGPAGSFELLKADPTRPWELYRGDTAAKADDKAVHALITDLTQKNAVRAFPADAAGLGLEKPTAVVSLWVEGIAKDDPKEEKKEEKKDEKKDEKPADKDKKGDKKEAPKPARPKLKDPQKPAVRISFGAVENNLVAAKREAGGETTLVKVPASILDHLKTGPLDYLDRTLPRFSEADPAKDATRLVLARDGVTTELAKDPKVSSPEGAWKFEKPADLAGRTADAASVDRILRTLNALRATKLVSEKAEPEVVDREFGLKTPSLKATVTVTKDGKPAAYEYDFGKEVEKVRVYARQGVRPNLVFEAEKVDLTPLTKDLQDPTVFRFDAAKAKGVKLTGWKDVAGTPVPLEFERKDATTWAAKTPKGYNVSSEKVNRLVSELSSLRAVKFAGKATPKDKETDALSPDKGGLAIEVTVEGEKEPYVLTVGNLDADKAAYFATANRLGDSLFTVRKDAFEKPKEKPAYFNP
jgi:hypothetical protein